MKEQEKFEIDVFQLVKVLWKRKFLIVLTAIIAGLAAFAYSSFVIKPQYTSTTRIYVVNRNQADKPGLTNQDLQAGAYLVKDYRESSCRPKITYGCKNSWKKSFSNSSGRHSYCIYLGSRWQS